MSVMVERLTADDVLKLFQLGMAGEQAAWTRLYEGMTGLMRFWTWQSTGLEDDGFMNVQDVISCAWLRFFQAMEKSKTQRSSRFPTGGAVLSYLRMCVKSTVTDNHRRKYGQDASGHFSWGDIELEDMLTYPDIETDVLADLACKELLDWFSADEQVVLIEEISGIPPRKSALLHNVPVQKIYAMRTEIRRRALATAQRDPQWPATFR